MYKYSRGVNPGLRVVETYGRESKVRECELPRSTRARTRRRRLAGGRWQKDVMVCRRTAVKGGNGLLAGGGRGKQERKRAREQESKIGRRAEGGMSVTLESVKPTQEFKRDMDSQLKYSRDRCSEE